jgi:hypothetical protein
MSQSQQEPPKLAQYLAELAADPGRLQALRTNPAREMARADLTDDEKDVLRRGDQTEINRLLQQHYPHLARTGLLVIVII